MTPEALLDLLRTGFRSVAGREPGRLAPEDDVQSLGLDSLQLLELVVWLEDTLHIEITPEQMASVRTVDDLVRTLQDRPR